MVCRVLQFVIGCTLLSQSAARRPGGGDRARFSELIDRPAEIDHGPIMSSLGNSCAAVICDDDDGWSSIWYAAGRRLGLGH